jgi:hypothetical protein
MKDLEGTGVGVIKAPSRILPVGNDEIHAKPQPE